jgi:hypothetical protein
MRQRVATALAAALICAVAGCAGAEDETTPPASPLARTLGTIGGGGEFASFGVGWAQPALVRDAGYGPGLIADALGPNGGSVVEARGQLRRRFDFEPLAARRLVTVGGSYAFGLRADGLDGARLARALAEAGLRSRSAGDVALIESDDYASVPAPLLDAGVRGLGAFDAFRAHSTVLAISRDSRAALLGRGTRLIEQPAYRAAESCLGDVVAARMIPDKLLLSTEQGVELIAAGVGTGGEVLCVLGGTTERADAIAANLQAGLAEAEVSRTSHEGVEVVRAELGPDDRERAGYVFGLLSGGGVVELINGGEAGRGSGP